MYYALLEGIDRQTLSVLSQLWEEKCQDGYERGAQMLTDLETEQEAQVQATDPNALTAGQVFKLAHFKYHYVQFGHCIYIRERPARRTQAIFYCRKLRDAQNLCLDFAKKQELPAGDWLQFQLLAVNCMCKAFEINNETLKNSGGALGCLAAAEEIIGAAVLRHDQGNLWECKLGPKAYYIEKVYSTGAFVVGKRALLSDKNGRTDIALPCYQKELKYTGWLAEHAAYGGNRQAAKNKLPAIQNDIDRLAGALPVPESRPVP